MPLLGYFCYFTACTQKVIHFIFWFWGLMGLELSD